MISKRTACALAMTVALGVLTACSDSKSSEPADTVAPTDSAAPVTDPPTTPAPTTIEPTTLAPTTTLAPEAFLRSDGVGPFDFGATYEDVLVGMPLVQMSDDGASFPTDNGDGTFSNLDGTSGFDYPTARTVCWDDGVGGYLCGYFGGLLDTALTLVGWDYFWRDPAVPVVVGTLFSESGATVNVLLSNVAGVPPISGECYGYTNVYVDDIILNVQAPPDETFGVYADDGTYTLNVPAPAATVTYLQTGRHPYYIADGEGDC